MLIRKSNVKSNTSGGGEESGTVAGILGSVGTVRFCVRILFMNLDI